MLPVLGLVEDRTYGFRLPCWELRIGDFVLHLLLVCIADWIVLFLMLAAHLVLSIRM